MAGIAGHDLRSRREDARTREVRVDLTDQHDHLAREVLSRVDVGLVRPAAAMTIGAMHVQRVAEFTHERIRTVHGSAWRKNPQTDGRCLREWPITQRVSAVVEFLWGHGLGLHASAMARE